MATTCTGWWRRRWRAEVPTADVPDVAHPSDVSTGVAGRDEMGRALARLTARQRATVVLRFYEDLSEADVAAALGCSVGTVKSTTARALEILRGAFAEPAAVEGGAR
jgi:RNA polymerase sigma factor (sigma-70 family)